MLKAGIIGATGYAGEELIRILLRHPQVKLSYLAAQIDKRQSIGEIFPEFKGKLNLECDNLNFDAALECDVIFLALPHTVSMQIVPKILSSQRYVIDLSADYRLKDYKVYECWYKCKHIDTENLKNAVYGLPEIYRDKIKKTKFVANPGCYPTAAILAVAPLLKDNLVADDIIIDAKSGFSGAGRIAQDDPFYEEIKESLKAYKVNQHQHMPEIEQELNHIAKKKVEVNFVPHVLNIKRGILETVYLKKINPPSLKVLSSLSFGGLSAEVSTKVDKNKNLINLYKEFYKNEPFVRIKEEGEFPQIKDVAGTNFCDIGIKDSAGTIIVISAIDNLLKGASGQAVQNLNIMAGWDEKTGLI